MLSDAMKKWVFFDFEAAAPKYEDSVDPQKARIIQIGLRCENPVMTTTITVNPGFDVPPEIETLTGLASAKIREAYPFKQFAQGIADQLAGRTLAGFNCNRYDVPLLAEEFERAEINFDWHGVTIVDIGELYKILSPRSLRAAVRDYCGHDPELLHDAGADAWLTSTVAEMMRERHTEVASKSDTELAAMSRYDRGFADPAGKLMYDAKHVLCFGTLKNKGVAVASEVGYAKWMLDRDFPLATKRMLREELSRLDLVAVARQPALFGE